MMTIGIHGTRRRLPRNSSAIPAKTGMAGLSSPAMSLGEADSRIDIGVQYVNEQVDAEDQNRLQDDDGLEQRKVAKDHRLVGQPADAGPGEYGLGDDRAGDQIADEHAPQGQHRDQGIA